MDFENDFEVVLDGPPPLDWDTYSRQVRQALTDFLSDESAGEKEAQSFLEQHPCLIPGNDAFEASGHPGPIHSTVFSQPVIPGITRRFPDFMWLPTDSETQWAVLIEIEDPRKKWFTQAGTPTSELTQALDQIATWRTLLSDPANQLQFRRMYDIAGRPLAIKYCLIYGRRSEATSRPEVGDKRLQMRRSDLHWMTYDRLTPNENARDCVSAKMHRGEILAITVPPTMKLYPAFMKHMERVHGKAGAALKSPYFPEPRRKFLAERLQYWEDRITAGKLGGFLPTQGE